MISTQKRGAWPSEHTANAMGSYEKSFNLEKHYFSSEKEFRDYVRKTKKRIHPPTSTQYLIEHGEECYAAYLVKTNL
jgi:hypothetical protein